MVLLVNRQTQFGTKRMLCTTNSTKVRNPAPGPKSLTNRRRPERNRIALICNPARASQKFRRSARATHRAADDIEEVITATDAPLLRWPLPEHLIDLCVEFIDCSGIRLADREGLLRIA